ncbi:phage tail sheath family protein [Sphingomonas sp. MMS12-HWE2-04]|uniref:phage tail sheath family protein n=1 Tax=Sphingomonas sp. MMS12-HWE2-04 TaxID=3234199 RepID=UPI003850B20B
MADQVRQYFVNGGGEAWILRTALNAQRASVLLKTFANADTLRLTARDPGALGNMVRAEVDYGTASPERTFNLRLYRQTLRNDGSFTASDVETHANLTMDPKSPRYAPDVLESASALVTGSDPAAPLAANPAVSIGGVIYSNTQATARATVTTAITGGRINVQVGERPPIPVAFGTPVGTPEAHIKKSIEDTFTANGVAVTITVTLNSSGGLGRVLQIASNDGAIVITPASGATTATALQLGIASGGVEVDSYSPRRPVPTGIVASPGNTASPALAWVEGLVSFGNAVRNTVTSFTLTDPANGAALAGGGFATNLTDKVFVDPAVPAGALGSLNAVRAALDELGGAITLGTANRWTVARQGVRLGLTPKFGSSNTGLDSKLTTSGGTDLGAAGNLFDIPSAGTGASNVVAYSLGRVGGAGGLGTRQAAVGADEGTDGVKPDLGRYIAAFQTIESALPSYNLLVLPRAEDQTDVERHGIWGVASASAAKRRGILLVDPDSTWNDIPAASAGADAIKIGVETRNAAVFWPRLQIPQLGSSGSKTVDPSGSIAGLMARNDGTFGVWTAPAGLEATIRGVTGISRVMSDEENGVLNPKALNAIRLFPSGVVSWGARMMVGANSTGNIDDKYIPVRRTMLFIEESLYRGLKFATFKPNAEPLWASIRLAAGSFMNSLMRQGAFASRNKLEAYYVLCDANTTTETDRNLGIVNVIVAFAPLKPAEFVVLTVRQIAGQVEI